MRVRDGLRFPQGLKPCIDFVLRAARLKSCPDTKQFRDLVFSLSVKSRPFNAKRWCAFTTATVLCLMMAVGTMQAQQPAPSSPPPATSPISSKPGSAAKLPQQLPQRQRQPQRKAGDESRSGQAGARLRPAAGGQALSGLRASSSRKRTLKRRCRATRRRPSWTPRIAIIRWRPAWRAPCGDGADSGRGQRPDAWR